MTSTKEPQVKKTAVEKAHWSEYPWPKWRERMNAVILERFRAGESLTVLIQDYHPPFVDAVFRRLALQPARPLALKPTTRRGR